VVAVPIVLGSRVVTLLVGACREVGKPEQIKQAFVQIAQSCAKAYTRVIRDSKR
jgi:hypothetical protein